MSSKARKQRATSPSPGLVICVLILVVIAVAAYANALQTPFLLDDESSIIKQGAIKPPLSLSKMLATKRPVVTASLAFNYAIGELSVLGYHVLNLVAHIICGMIWFGLARYTLLQPVFRDRYRAGANYLACFAAAVLLVHPIQTESVTYTHQRAEIFVSIALLAWVWTAAAAARRGTWRRSLPALVCIAAFGALSKRSFIMAPFLFALYDWCFIAEGRLERMGRRRLLHVALGTAVLGIGLAAWALEDYVLAGFDLEGLGPWRYLTWPFGVLLYYARLILDPDRLCFDCGYFGPWPVLHSPLGDMVWVPALILVLVGAAAWLARKRLPLVTFGIWGSGIVLLPTSSIMPLADVYVEHRLYLPIGLLALLAAAAAFDVSKRAVLKEWLPEKAAMTALIGGAVTLCMLLAWLTLARNHLYSDPLLLYQYSATIAPENRRLQYNLANEYNRAGQLAKAVDHYKQALRSKPFSSVYVNLGNAYAKLGDLKQALSAYEAALEYQPNLALAYRNLAKTHWRMGNRNEGIAAAERAIQLQPRHFNGRKMLGSWYDRMGRTEEALREYRAAARVKPRDQDMRRRIEAARKRLR